MSIFISRYILRFRGVDNTEEVIPRISPSPRVADRDKSKCGRCYTGSKVVVFSQSTTRSPCASNDDDSGSMSALARKFSLGDYGLTYLTQQKCVKLFLARFQLSLHCSAFTKSKNAFAALLAASNPACMSGEKSGGKKSTFLRLFGFPVKVDEITTRGRRAFRYLCTIITCIISHDE